MTIRKLLDKDYYISIREGIEFYYFGNGCIVDFFSSSIAYIEESELELLAKCNGNNLLSEIIQEGKRVGKETWGEKIDQWFSKGILICGQKPQIYAKLFHGKLGKYYPKELVIELTDQCNYMCPFCYKNASMHGKFISDKEIERLNSIIYGKVNNILLTGGEPTLHKHYTKYIELFSEYAKVRMITNGSVLYRHDAAVLKKLDTIQFSIYGCNDNDYAKMTGANRGFSDLCQSVEFAQKNNISVKLALTLCDETMERIEDFINMAIFLKVGVLKIGIADVFGRGKYLYNQPKQFEEKMQYTYTELTRLKRKYRKIINLEIGNINVNHIGQHCDIYQNVYRGSLQCGCGSEYMVISPIGMLRACQMIPEEYFGIKNDNALQEHINGDFHINHLLKATKNYYADNCFDRRNISPCHALEKIQEENL